MTFDAKDIVQFVFWTFLGVFLLSLFLALALNKTVKSRTGWALGVLGFFAALIGLGYYKVFVQPDQMAAAEAKAKGLPSANERKERYVKAKALFDERCKSAGEKIYRTVDSVEGVLLLNLRSRGVSASVLNDPNWVDAALPNEPGQTGYISTFLLWEHFEGTRNDRGYLNHVPSDRPGYRYVDARDSDELIFRYQLDPADAKKLLRELRASNQARYAVSFVNMINPADRMLWVAGTKVTISDTQTREVLAEKIWYAMDPGQGNTDGGRSPWASAIQCPNHLGWSGGSTRFFVDRILKPRREK